MSDSMLIVFGSINLDVSVRSARLPRPGETLMGSGALLSPGGKGANQAHAAQRFGVGTRLFGKVGSDPFAEAALAALVSAGVDLAGVAVSPGDSTGLALISVSDDGDNTIVVAPGANLAAHADQVPDEALQASRVLLLQLEVPLDQSLALAHRARRFGCKAFLNASPLPAGLQLAAKSVDLIIVNGIELDQLAASHQVLGIDAMDTAHALARALEMDVLVTLGAEGAYLAQRDGGHAAARALPVTPLDTTGAGDTFAGVFAATIASGEPAQRAMDCASVAAGLACLKAGAQLAQPSRQEVDARMVERKIARLA